MVGPNDPLWLPEDRDKILQYMSWKSQFCPKCNTLNSGWVDKRGRYLDEPRYEAISHKCYGCEAIDDMQSMIPEKEKGVYVLAVRREIGAPMEIERREYERELWEREQRLKEREVPFGKDYS